MVHLVAVEKFYLRDLQDADEGNERDFLASMTTDPTAWTIVWIAFLGLLLVCPFITNKHRRKLCWRRIAQREWNVGEEDVDTGTTFLPGARVFRSYPIGDPRHTFTLEEAEVEMKKFILVTLEPFSKIIDENDLEILKDDMEGQTLHSLNSSTMSNEHSDVGDSNHSPWGMSTKVINYMFPASAAKDNDTILQNVKDEDQYVNATLKLPPPGTSIFDYLNENSDEEVPSEKNMTKKQKNEKDRKLGSNLLIHRRNECSICLDEITEGQTISWSSLDCEHVFHQQCILNWLMTLGRKSIASANVNVRNVCSYDMRCPNCRQNFIQNAAG